MKRSTLVGLCLTAMVFVAGGRSGLAAASSQPVVTSITLDECIARALANNLDVRIERINPQIESWGIVREQGVFDPAFTAQSGYSDSHEALDPQQISSLNRTNLIDKELHFGSGLIGRLPTGTQYGLNAFDTRYAGTFVTNFLHNGSVGLNLSQPLLKNFGLGVNTAGIQVARKNRQMAREVLSQQLIVTISDVSHAYHELNFAIADHNAKFENLDSAKSLLHENRRRVEAGVSSPLEITQAEAGVAEREEAVLIAAQAIKEAENLLKQLTSGEVTEWHDASLVPADQPVAEIVETDVVRSTRTALAERPDFRQAKQEVERRGILLKYSRNQLWPQVDLQGGYGLNGSGVTFDKTYREVTHSDLPQWSVGVVVTVPLGNHQARADYHSAQLEQEKALLALKRIEQSIVVEVDNAVRRVQTNLQRLDATRAASRLAEASLKAEETKLQAGTSTSFQVLQAQAQLAAVRTAALRARLDYDNSLVDLARIEGTTLEHHSVKVADDN